SCHLYFENTKSSYYDVKNSKSKGIVIDYIKSMVLTLNKIHGTITIEIPKNKYFKTCEFNLGSSDFKTIDLNADKISLITTSGDLEISNLFSKGDLSIHCVKSDIEIKKVECAGELHITNASGDIDIDYAKGKYIFAYGDANYAAFVVLGHGGSFREDIRHVTDCRFDKTDGRAFYSVAHGLVIDCDRREAGAACILKHFLAHQIKIARACEGHLVAGFHDGLLLCRHGDCGAFGGGHGDRRGGQVAVCLRAKFCRNIVIVVVVFHFSLPLLRFIRSNCAYNIQFCSRFKNYLFLTF
ncbi:MAG: DUF4097 family beta strand repeat-containing protein, partial [Alphaproteobacteria bacterium]